MSLKKKEISVRSTVVVSKDQVSADLAGDSAILHLKSGIYYGLNPVGTRIWNLLQKPKKVNGVLSCLLQEYQVEPLRCEEDLLALLKQLISEGLVRVVDEKTP